ncbi:sugar phosphate isomerase/epimerase family protein [Pedosphaera parvula]|nr:sugar phosphate isomerase/epimerase family protein [Pedosphaera parvula]
MNLNRRKFLTVSALAGIVSATTPRPVQAVTLPDPSTKARLRLSCQDTVAPGKTIAEKLDFLEANGFEAFEPHGKNLLEIADELQKAMQGRKIKIGVICGGMQGSLISDDEAVRSKAMDSIKEVLTAAGALGATGMVMVPARPNQTKLEHWEARELLVKVLPEIGEHAQKVGMHMLLEPLNRKECHFLRQVADGAAICRDVNHPGIRVMGDFWHMTFEETSDMAAFVAGGKYLRHVHMASRKSRKMPGEDAGDNYVDGFKGLKLIGYQDLVSFECGLKGDRSKALIAAAKLLREQWEAA